MDTRHKREGFYLKILYALRTIIMYIYMFGYMLLYYPVLRRGEKALAAGDRETLRRTVDYHIPRWCRGLLRVAGVQLIVEGRENIPAGGPAVFVGNHRSYFDIPLMLVGLDKPHGILAKEELAHIPLLSRWMRLLGCVYVQRDDVRGSLQALKDASAVVGRGESFTIFPEGTRYKGEEGGVGEFKAGAFRIAIKTGVPVVPVAISGARGLYESHNYIVHPGTVRVTILPAIQTAGMSREEQRQLPEAVRQNIQAALTRLDHTVL